MTPDPAAPLNAVLAALDRAPMPTLFTAPNTDPGGAAMRAQIEAFVARRPWAAYRATLGGRLYANALRHATVMVGNSSSGIIEAALFGLAVINVGARQRGRTRGPNVHDCAAESTQVSRLLGSVAGRRYDPAQVSLYGDGRSGPRIAQVITELPDRDKLMAKLLVGASAVQRTGQLELV